MARLGEGDPRWIVTARDDGHNVNGWHWEEKSILGQVKARLTDLFDNVPLDLEGQPGALLLRACTSITGEAAITKRKGNKKLVIYDLSLVIDWEATLVGSEKPVKGTVKVEEFSACSEEESDYVVETTVVGTGTEQDTAKRLMDLHGKPVILQRLLSLAQELKTVDQPQDPQGSQPQAEPSSVDGTGEPDAAQQ
mmetsp:Transcript_8564/g.14726  ORF Transcript_8564/g.14726 Transcript_8564/m.14726 type:complete len:194 (+) Transcript_8564:175-756(+)